MKSTLIKSLLLLTVFVGFSLGLAACSEKGNAANKKVGRVIQMDIGKMTCGSCAYSVKTALAKVKNVVKAEVSYETKIAKVYVEKDKSVDKKELTKAVEKIGYTVKSIN